MSYRIAVGTLSLIVQLAYVFAYVVVFFGVKAESEHLYNVWEGVHILEGIFGATMLIYPIQATRLGFTEMFGRWMCYLLVIFVLIIIALIISELTGKGAIPI